jgi:hypothetical protein
MSKTVLIFACVAAFCGLWPQAADAQRRECKVVIRCSDRPNFRPYWEEEGSGKTIEEAEAWGQGQCSSTSWHSLVPR